MKLKTVEFEAIPEAIVGRDDFVGGGGGAASILTWQPSISFYCLLVYFWWRYLYDNGAVRVDSFNL